MSVPSPRAKGPNGTLARIPTGGDNIRSPDLRSTSIHFAAREMTLKPKARTGLSRVVSGLHFSSRDLKSHQAAYSPVGPAQFRDDLTSFSTLWPQARAPEKATSEASASSSGARDSERMDWSTRGIIRVVLLWLTRSQCLAATLHRFDIFPRICGRRFR